MKAKPNKESVYIYIYIYKSISVLSIMVMAGHTRASVWIQMLGVN
jgi:hypothetical protein